MAQTAFILILTLDDERGQQLRESLREQRGHSCLVVHSASSALDSVQARTPDVVVIDAGIDLASVGPLIEYLDQSAPDASLVLVGIAKGALAPRSLRIIAVDAGADPAAMIAPIALAAEKAVARREDRLLQHQMQTQSHEAFEGMVGTSPAMRRIIDRIRKAGPTKLNVLIIGETGTGKELIARALHKHSPRARREMKTVNCAALPETLLESQLFGHVKGAFTGAIADQKGFFVAADNGTLFLDEIGDMPLTAQSKLLRALEQREITPVGSTETRKVDVRVIAATNSDLRKLVDDKKFREDLYYRLHGWEIRVPPLRERREDIPLLVHHALQRANREHGMAVPGVSSEALHFLARYHWPGNVRELENVITAVACEVGDRQIEADDLPEYIRGPRDLVPISNVNVVGLTMEQMERLMIDAALRSSNGNREQAAKMLGIGTRTLYRKIKEFNL